MSQLYHEFGVTLERSSPNEPWGIRLAGGSDLNTILIIVRVKMSQVSLPLPQELKVLVIKKRRNL